MIQAEFPCRLTLPQSLNLKLGELSYRTPSFRRMGVPFSQWEGLEEDQISQWGKDRIKSSFGIH